MSFIKHRDDMILGHVYKHNGERILVLDYADNGYGLMKFKYLTGKREGEMNTAHCSWFHYVGPYADTNKKASLLLDKEW